MFIKLEKVVVKRLDLEDLEEDKLIEKLQGHMLEPKMISENLQKELAELKEEQKKRSLK